MNVLVTGGAGFIGSHLCEALAARGDRVTVLDNFDGYYERALKESNLARALAAGVKLLEGDIRSEDDVAKAYAAAKPEVVVHLAARAGVRPSIAQPVLYSQVNVDGTTVMLEAARKAGTRRFVFASSSSVYGARSNPPFREDDRIDRPVSPYAATKAAGECLCATWTHLYQLETVGLRFFTVFGPRQRPDLAISKFVKLIRAGKPLPFFGDGSTARDYTFIGDIVRGVVAAADHAWPQFEPINLGGSHSVSLREMVAGIEHALGQKAVLDRQPDQPGDVPLTSASVEKAGRLLGWQPKVGFAEGLSRYVQWLDSPDGAAWR